MLKCTMCGGYGHDYDRCPTNPDDLMHTPRSTADRNARIWAPWNERGGTPWQAGKGQGGGGWGGGGWGGGGGGLAGGGISTSNRTSADNPLASPGMMSHQAAYRDHR